MKIFLCVIALCVAASAASEINFDVHPHSITPGYSSNLTMRCSINDAVLSDVTLIGKRVTARTVDHVTAIVISRINPDTGVNETVARVSTFEQAVGLVDAGKLTVSGITDSSYPGEDGYLELMWTNPTADQVGPYFCEAFTLNTEQHPENFEARVDVVLESLSTEELLLYIISLQNRIDALEKEVNQSSSSSSPSGGQSNTQLGNVRCDQGTNDYNVVFSPPFSYTPDVYTAVSGYSSSEAYVFTPSTLNIDQNGFTLRCVSNRETDILWIAQ